MKLLRATVITLVLQRVWGLEFSAPFKEEHFQVSGDAQVTDSLVNLVHGKNQKGAIWSKNPLTDSDFTLEAVVRTAADVTSEPGTSGYTIWYTTKPVSGDVHGGSDTWDGLAIMIDSLAGNMGSVRGHLNDGTTKFSSLKDVAGESLTLCRLDYRSITGPITVRVGYSEADGFVVDVNGQKCFLSMDIVLPKGNYLGITANSDTSKDTLSVEKLAVSKGMKPELLEKLPQHQGEPRSEAAPPKVETPPQKEADKNAAQWPGPSLTKQEVSELLAPTRDRLELMEVKITQLKSVVDQLVETLSLSMSQVTERQSTGGGEDTNRAVTALQKEIVNLRSQIADWHKQGAAQSVKNSDNTRVQKDSPSLWVLVLVLLPVQLAAVSIYHTWLKKRYERHAKLP